ncbi:MAG: GDSL family lipase [Clostridiales bacterium]|nr:GDSL family lipase [Candidatus Blautia equi]
MTAKELISSVRIAGRYTVQNGILYPAGSAAFIEFKTCSAHVAVTMTSDHHFGEETLRARAAVFIDGEREPSMRLALEKGEHTYTVFHEDKAREVVIRIMKYSEEAFASMGIVSIESDGPVTATASDRELLMEFVGDSITCGYGIEGVAEVDIFTTEQENPWKAYACRTAELLQADFQLLSWSGNGMISQYIDDSVNERRTEKPLIPEMYPYSDRELEERMGIAPLTLWQDEREPDLVVINIGTNDSSYTRDIPERNAFFNETYSGFVDMVREKHPKAKIICLIGLMSQCVHEEIEKVVLAKRDGGDKDVYYLKAPLQNGADGMGTDYHPSEVTHIKAAEMLAEFIRHDVLGNEEDFL